MEAVKGENLKIFTDGSANPQKKMGAWAALIINGSEEVILQDHALNVNHQQMELQAVISALRYVNDNFDTTKPIIVYTDSQYVEKLPVRQAKLESKGYCNQKGKPLPNADLLRQFYHFYYQLNASIEKVPAHQKSNTGFDENRKVDKLARKILRHIKG